jgi:hypothetical protein
MLRTFIIVRSNILKISLLGLLCFLTEYLSRLILTPTTSNFYTGYFTSDNEPGGIENATHNTFPKLTCLYIYIRMKKITIKIHKIIMVNYMFLICCSQFIASSVSRCSLEKPCWNLVRGHSSTMCWMPILNIHEL